MPFNVVQKTQLQKRSKSTFHQSPPVSLLSQVFDSIYSFNPNSLTNNLCKQILGSLRKYVLTEHQQKQCADCDSGSDIQMPDIQIFTLNNIKNLIVSLECNFSSFFEIQPDCLNGPPQKVNEQSQISNFMFPEFYLIH